MTRTHTATRTVTAGCNRCGTLWTEKNAQGIAVQHTDRWKHATWVEVTLRIEYGDTAIDPVQGGLF